MRKSGSGLAPYGRRATHTGFTIVELLIVIVIITILAAISIVAYTGMQQRARNAIRAQDVASIQKALELYRAEHGHYPGPNPPGSNLPAGFTAPYGTTSGYSYSIATDDSWLRELRQSGFMDTIPEDPINNNSNYYIYYRSGPNGIGSCPQPVYALIVRGWEGGMATMPPDARTLNCSITSGITAGWIQSNSQAVFSNLNKPLPD